MEDELDTGQFTQRAAHNPHLGKTAEKDFQGRISAVRSKHPANVPFIFIKVRDGTYTCGICHAVIAPTIEGWAHT